MLTRAICVLLAASLTITALPPPADAQFGLKRTFKKVVRAPARIVTAPIRVLPRVGGVFRGTFGVIAAVAVGAVIFDRLHKHERREVARRSKVVVAKDPDQRVSDTYVSKDGRRQVTIVAEPMQTAAVLKTDPAVIVVADKVVSDGPATPPAAQLPGGGGATVAAGGSTVVSDAGPPSPPVPPSTPAEAPPAAKPIVDEELVRISEVPPETQCRKVTTELEIRKKKGQETPDEKTANTAIFCQTAPGEWKPASA